MTLRARLFLALLALALIPIAVFTLFTLDQLGRATEHWVRPGVSHALEAGLEVSKAALARLDAVAISQADAWADDWAAGAPAGPARAAERRRLARAGLDFAQSYERGPQGWRLVDQLTPAGMLDLTRVDLAGRLPDSLAVPIVIHGEHGVLAGVSAAGARRAVAVGWWMAPDFFGGITQVAEGAGHYQQLGLVVALQRNYVWVMVGGLVVTLSLVALLLSAALARGMARPLGELSAAIERVASEDLSARVRPGGARELRTLGQAFNAMAERLATAREVERRAEREAAWRQVARYLAHEINNMLSPIGSAAYRIERRIEDFPEEHRPVVRESLEVMRQSLDDLGRLAEQFSQYARLPEPRLEPLDLAETVRAAAQLERAGAVALHLPDRPLIVRGDRLLVSRALHNLLVNAREATEAAGPIEVRAGAGDDRAFVEVLDRGPGLDPELLARVFDPFVSTKRRGSGLGLSLVRDIMTQHGGSVGLENREGGGACARLVFPMARPEAGQA